MLRTGPEGGPRLGGGDDVAGQRVRKTRGQGTGAVAGLRPSHSKLKRERRASKLVGQQACKINGAREM